MLFALGGSGSVSIRYIVAFSYVCTYSLVELIKAILPVEDIGKGTLRQG